jgi:hypothetical protein
VKILAVQAVSAGQRPIEPRGISTDSARPVRDERRFRVGPRPVLIVVRTHAEKSRQRGNRPVPRQVHRRYISALTCQYPAAGQVTRPCGQRRADGAHAGRTPGNAGNPRAARCRADMAALRAGQAASRQYRHAGSRIVAYGSGPGTRRFMPCWRRASAACRCVPPRCPVRPPPARQQPPPAASPSASSQPGCQSRGRPGISRA